ncbi:c-type cytochrome [Duganella violaceipulchra]|uniref:Cytochrome c n=1 Tax=Duganella violaceipulchra TaxID=2849652 RepID=A0AA41HDL9_9BURK|nr:cytochrome c family protein [Duganella violaceicalia]MBV6322236.1 cytochrome c family protein [Duganella violaceicalia]MCP2011383.1 cytochrome c [Duganella violaceicalia]
MRAYFLAVLLVAGQVSAAGDARVGEALFKRCASCHQVGPYAQGGFGPQLNGIIGRRAASTKDYKYSEAMKKSGLVWDEKTLAAYLCAPHDVVPGTSMRFWGIKDEQQVADLLSYMRSLR